MRASLFKDGVVFFITRLDDTLYWSKSLKIIMIIITIKPPFDFFRFRKALLLLTVLELENPNSWMKRS